jgi:hypothetical protein
MYLLYFILICYGLTQILCYGKIFDNIRPESNSFGGLGLLFHCSMCMGFHVGLFVYLFSTFSKLFTFEFSFIDMFFMACLSSGTSYILDKLIDDNGLRVNK